MYDLISRVMSLLYFGLEVVCFYEVELENLMRWTLSQLSQYFSGEVACPMSIGGHR